MSAQSISMEPLAYSRKEARRHMGNISNWKFDNEVRAGRLRVVKSGRRTLILRRDLLRWLEGLPPKQPDEAAA